MTCKLTLAAAALLAAWPATATAQSARSIFAEVAGRQLERWEQVQDYLMEELAEGAPIAVPIYYEQNVVDGRVTFRRVPMNEWAKKAAGTDAIGPEHYELMAQGYEMVGDVHRAHPENPFNLYIADMMYDGAAFLRAGAEAERTGAAYADDDPDAANVGGMAAFARRASLAGRETVAGRDAFHLRADGLSDVELTQPDGAAEFTLQSASVWIDSERYVPLRLRMELQVETEGRTSPISLEMRMEDYEDVGPLYEATRHVMRLSGIHAMMSSNPKDREEWERTRAELAQARTQMAQLRAQMDSLPPAAQGFVRGQLDRALQQLEMMESEGAIETVVHRRVVAINEGPPERWVPTLTPGG